MMASEKADWKDLTPEPLVGAVTHIRERFEEEEFALDYVTQQQCFKELHLATPPDIAPAVFKKYMDYYKLGLNEVIGRQFRELLQIGLANAELADQNPVDWAKSHLEHLISEMPDRVISWIKHVCDQPPASGGDTPVDVEEFIHWRSWRAPKLIQMQPSGNTPYDQATAWSRADQEKTEHTLNGLSKRFNMSLVFHLNRIAGDAYVQLAKEGRRIRPPSTQSSSKEKTTGDSQEGSGDSPVAFISYSWDSEPHKQWVLELASRLRAEGGVRIVLDRWDLPRGGDKTVFMERAVANSKFVVLVCTPSYAERANYRTGGVGYEATIITAELAENINQGKFIPVLRDGDWKSSLPVWIKSKFGVDLRNNPYSEDEYGDLVRTLHQEPLKAPPIGPKPAFAHSAPIREPNRALTQAPVRFFNFSGTPGPLIISGKQHWMKGPFFDLWGMATVVNYTPTPVKITPIRLVLEGKERADTQVFFRLKSDVRYRFERISLVGNHKDDYELHFIFKDDNCPQSVSGELIIQTDEGDEPFAVSVKFP